MVATSYIILPFVGALNGSRLAPRTPRRANDKAFAHAGGMACRRAGVVVLKERADPELDLFAEATTVFEALAA